MVPTQRLGSGKSSTLGMEERPQPYTTSGKSLPFSILPFPHLQKHKPHILPPTDKKWNNWVNQVQETFNVVHDIHRGNFESFRDNLFHWIYSQH